MKKKSRPMKRDLLFLSVCVSSHEIFLEKELPKGVTLKLDRGLWIKDNRVHRIGCVAKSYKAESRDIIMPELIGVFDMTNEKHTRQMFRGLECYFEGEGSLCSLLPRMDGSRLGQIGILLGTFVNELGLDTFRVIPC